jgi:hypothetical protein
MAKAKASLEEGLNRSADRRGFSGKQRHRYIGGALHNMGKSKPRSGGTSGGHSKRPTRLAAHTPTVVRKPAPPAPKPAAKKAYAKPGVVKREKLDLVVRKNVEASTKLYDAYSIYRRGGGQYSSSVYRKKGIAEKAKNDTMHAHNHPLGEHHRGTLT